MATRSEARAALLDAAKYLAEDAEREQRHTSDQARMMSVAALAQAAAALFTAASLPPLPRRPKRRRG